MLLPGSTSLLVVMLIGAGNTDSPVSSHRANLVRFNRIDNVSCELGRLRIRI